jgi:hypothetical protein
LIRYVPLAVLIFVFLGIVLITGHEEKVIREKKELVFSGKREDICYVVFRIEDEEVRIKRNGTWFVEGMSKSVVNETLFDDILGDLMALEKITTVTAITQVDIEEFGFIKPFISVTLQYGAKDSESLIIGTDHPSGNSFYAMMRGCQEIFLVGSLHPLLIKFKLRKLLEETKNSTTNTNNTNGP